MAKFFIIIFVDEFDDIYPSELFSSWQDAKNAATEWLTDRMRSQGCSEEQIRAHLAHELLQEVCCHYDIHEVFAR